MRFLLVHAQLLASRRRRCGGDGRPLALPLLLALALAPQLVGMLDHHLHRWLLLPRYKPPRDRDDAARQAYARRPQSVEVRVTDHAAQVCQLAGLRLLHLHGASRVEARAAEQLAFSTGLIRMGGRGASRVKHEPQSSYE